MGIPVNDFIHDLTAADLPDAVVTATRTCVLDLLGVAAAGTTTRLSHIARDHATHHMAAGSDGPAARLLFDGRRASPAGAAFAGAATIDSFDAHDGHVLTKGHAGVAVLPAVLAFAEARPFAAGGEFLAAVAVGYELALRAGIALHATACDYHTSGAWNALACAAVGARHLGLDAEATRHALGIAEFYGPRSPMMRCIDHPTMVKDGSAWGAFGGVSAAFLAAEGFTGAPAVLVDSAETAALWSDLGTRWRILEQYFKPHPVCRWAQPAIEAALTLRRQHGVPSSDIERVRVATFHEAKRLDAHAPSSTEEAQYSLPFPVAAAIVHGTVGVREIGPEGCADPEVLRLSQSMEVVEDAVYSARFPAERWARVTFVLKNGRELRSEPTTTRGDPSSPLEPDELVSKYRTLAWPVLGEHRGALIEAGVATLGPHGGRHGGEVADLLDDLLGMPATCA